MVLKKEVWGIKIRPVQELDIPDTHFYTEVAKYNKEYSSQGCLFITTPRIQQIIKRNNLAEGEGLGSIFVLIRPNPEGRFGWITTKTFYPFNGDYFDKNGKYKESSGYPSLIGIGAGTIAEHAIERYLRKKFPGYQIGTSNNVTAKRYAQLIKRGRKFHSAQFVSTTNPKNLSNSSKLEGFYQVNPKRIPIEAAEALSKRQMLKQRQKNRRIKCIP